MPPFSLCHRTILEVVPASTPGTVFLYRDMTKTPVLYFHAEDLRRRLWSCLGTFKYFNFAVAN